MVKTTVYLDSDVALSLRALSDRSGRPQAELIREAVAKFAAENRPPLPAGMGKFDSGHTNTSIRRKQILKVAARGDKWR